MATVQSRTDRSGKLSCKQQGAAWENQARHYLERQGMAFIRANFRVRGGEIDLIMRDQGTLVFVEVRFRRHDAFGTAAESIGYQKQRRVLHAAKIWLAGMNHSLASTDCRFDVVAITGNQLEWLTNAFTLDQ